MNVKSQIQWGIIPAVVFLLSACSHQHARSVTEPAIVGQTSLPKPVVIPLPSVVKPPKVVEMTPAPAPYRDIVISPVPLKPVPKPVESTVPSVKPVATILPPAPVVPKVKAKGIYRGTVPVDSTLRQQYQQ